MCRSRLRRESLRAGRCRDENRWIRINDRTDGPKEERRKQKKRSRHLDIWTLGVAPVNHAAAMAPNAADWRVPGGRHMTGRGRRRRGGRRRRPRRGGPSDVFLFV